VSDPEKLLHIAKQTKTVHHSKIIEWEVDLQKQIIAKEKIEKTNLHFILEQVKKISEVSYQQSLVGFGGELGSLLGNTLSSNKMMQMTASYLKRIVLQCIKWFVFSLTFSQEKAERVSVNIADWLNENNLLVLFKNAGVLLGVYYTYSAGLMNLIRLLIMNQVALQTSQYMSSVSKRALPFDINPTANNCFRIMIIVCALLETLYSKNAAPCIRALSGLSGSVGMTALGQHVLPKSQNANQKPTAEEILTWFVLSNLGYSFGQHIADAGINSFDNIHQKLATRDVVITTLRDREAKNELTDLEITTPSLGTPSALWVNSENPLEMSWRNARDGFFYRANCQITPRNVQCDTTPGVRIIN
jgi:hypothetical protein